MKIIAELAQGFEGRPDLARLLMKAATGDADEETVFLISTTQGNGPLLTGDPARRVFRKLL